MTREELAGVLAYLGAALGRPVGADQAEVYFDLLGDLPPPALLAAAKRALLESPYPTLPTPGTLRALALEALAGPRPSAAEAWALVRRAVGRFGHNREAEGLASLPETARRAADALGWRSLCDSTEPEICRAQFTRAYDTLAERERREALMPPALRALVGGVGLGPDGTRPALPGPEGEHG